MSRKHRLSRRALRALDRIVLRYVERAAKVGAPIYPSDVYVEVVKRHPHVTYWDVFESLERLYEAGLVRFSDASELALISRTVFEGSGGR